MISNTDSVINSALQLRSSTLFLTITTNKAKVPLASFYNNLSIPLFSQLGTVSDNLVNCVRQELDGITEWFICRDICSDNHS